MLWFVVMQVVSMLVEPVRLGRQSDSYEDLEILLAAPVTDHLRT